MNLLKKLFRRHGSSGSQAAGNDILFSPEDSRFQSLISLPEPIVHPGDMMEELGIAVCMHRKNSVAFGSEDIKAYEVLSPDDNKHLCFFLGMLKTVATTETSPALPASAPAAKTTMFSKKAKASGCR